MSTKRTGAESTGQSLDQTATTVPRSTARRLLGSFAKLLLTALVIYFVGDQVVKHWPAVVEHDWRIAIWPLIGSILLGLVSLGIFSSCLAVILRSFGHHVSYRYAFKIAYWSNLGRYVPGKLWQVFGMFYLAGKAGIPAETAGAGFVIGQLFALPASLLLYVGISLTEPEIFADRIALIGPGAAYSLTAALLVLCVIMVVYPKPVVGLGNWLLARLGRAPVIFRLDKGVAVGLLGGYFLGWILFGMAFWLLVRALLPDTSCDMLAAIGVFNVSYQIGYLAFFAPGGFGPRELVMGALLTPLIGPLGPAVAVMTRLWSLVIEALSALLSVFVRQPGQAVS